VGTGWANEFESVRIPLAAFTTDGNPLDLGALQAVRFGFGAGFGAPRGRIGLDDIGFALER
jgi:hypothetical protein